jgi:hypothetical protein
VCTGQHALVEFGTQLIGQPHQAAVCGRPACSWQPQGRQQSGCWRSSA